ncbi:hypothetical protein [Actinokineospora enzanensis]|uniref:hypothetical protein n=1 Tax=Actinokineospora enzanensis TaxID=155975 RepID=UPI0003766591|nr:hypothetical protein [Actinokineospora enzanensis]
MANQNVMSTPIFDELLREMTEGTASLDEPVEPAEATPPKPPAPGGRRRARSS